MNTIKTELENLLFSVLFWQEHEKENGKPERVWRDKRLWFKKLEGEAGCTYDACRSLGLARIETKRYRRKYSRAGITVIVDRHASPQIRRHAIVTLYVPGYATSMDNHSLQETFACGNCNVPQAEYERFLAYALSLAEIVYVMSKKQSMMRAALRVIFLIRDAQRNMQFGALGLRARLTTIYGD